MDRGRKPCKFKFSTEVEVVGCNPFLSQAHSLMYIHSQDKQNYRASFQIPRPLQVLRVWHNCPSSLLTSFTALKKKETNIYSWLKPEHPRTTQGPLKLHQVSNSLTRQTEAAGLQASMCQPSKVPKEPHKEKMPWFNQAYWKLMTAAQALYQETHRRKG